MGWHETLNPSVVSRIIPNNHGCLATPSPGSLRSPPSPPRGEGCCPEFSCQSRNTSLARAIAKPTCTYAT